jgi:hypothetical protein
MSGRSSSRQARRITAAGRLSKPAFDNPQARSDQGGAAVATGRDTGKSREMKSECEELRELARRLADHLQTALGLLALVGCDEDDYSEEWRAEADNLLCEERERWPRPRRNGRPTSSAPISRGSAPR